VERARGKWKRETDLNITRPPIQIQVQILDLAIVRKLIVQILLASLLMHIRDDDDPAFDGADGCRIRVRLHGCRFAVCVWRVGLSVDVHLVGHDGAVWVARLAMWGMGARER
jgi:hypothetical protein